MEMDLPIDTSSCARGTDGVCVCVCANSSLRLVYTIEHTLPSVCVHVRVTEAQRRFS